MLQVMDIMTCRDVQIACSLRVSLSQLPFLYFHPFRCQSLLALSSFHTFFAFSYRAFYRDSSCLVVESRFLRCFSFFKKSVKKKIIYFFSLKIFYSKEYFNLVLEVKKKIGCSILKIVLQIFQKYSKSNEFVIRIFFFYIFWAFISTA